MLLMYLFHCFSYKLMTMLMKMTKRLWLVSGSWASSAGLLGHFGRLEQQAIRSLRLQYWKVETELWDLMSCHAQ